MNFELVPGVVAPNLLFLAVGYALLGRRRYRASWAGVALLVGAGSVGTLVFFATIAGLHASLAVAAMAALVLAAIGLAGLRGSEPQSRRAGPVGAVAGAAFGVIAAVCALGVIGGFRSSPWLDDAWGIWLPKGLALWHHGLDERLFVPNGDFVAFGVPDYPLWWSIVTSLDVQAVGDVDVRVMCAQLAVLTVAFVGAAARLLWGYVRPSLLAGGLLLLVLSPDLWRHVQGGVADLPLAIYVALFALGVALWVGAGDPFALVVAGVGGVTAVQIKTEGIAEVLIVAAVAALAARPRRRVRGLGLVTALAAASSLPWLLWRSAHDVPGRTSVGDAFQLDHAGRAAQAAEELGQQLFDPASWLVVVPLLAGLAIAVYLRERRIDALLPLLGLAAGFAFLVWAYWVNPDPIDYLLATSAYRTIDPLVLAAAVFLPLEAEYFLRR
jgi:hypothetical protein